MFLIDYDLDFYWHMAFQHWKQQRLAIIFKKLISDQIEKGRQDYFKPEIEVSKN